MTFVRSAIYIIKICFWKSNLIFKNKFLMVYEDKEIQNESKVFIIDALRSGIFFEINTTTLVSTFRNFAVNGRGVSWLMNFFGIDELWIKKSPFLWKKTPPNLWFVQTWNFTMLYFTKPNRSIIRVSIKSNLRFLTVETSPTWNCPATNFRLFIFSPIIFHIMTDNLWCWDNAWPFQ